MESLSIFTNNYDGSRTEFALADGLSVGRGPDCDVRVANASLSRVHFIFEAHGDGFEVVSQHRHGAGHRTTGVPLGVYLNGERVPGKRPVAAGDVLSTSPDPGPGQPTFHIGLSEHPVPPRSLVPAEKPKGCLALIFGG